MTYPNFAKLEYKQVREVWSDEARDFTPWLLNSADYLAEALGIDLELTAREHAVGRFSLDLIGKDLTNDCQLIVENQLAKSDHSHLGQLLTYAAGTDAKTVVWICTEFRDEHRQALVLLNNLAGDGARFFGIELQVAVIANSPPAPILNVVVEPSAWRSEVRAERASGDVSNLGASYRAFWGQYLEQLHETHPGLTKVRVPQADNWMVLNYPRTGIAIAAAFKGGGGLACELNIQLSSAHACRAIFDTLLQERSEIERRLGTSLEWDPMEGRKRCSLRLSRDGSIADDALWPKLTEWLMTSHLTFHRVFYPIVRGLDASLWTEAALD